MNVLNVRIENFIIVDIISINYKTITNNINKIFTRTFEKHKKKSKSAEDLKIPYVPFICPITKRIRDDETVRDILIYNPSNQIKPKLSWYNPNFDEMIPTNWFEEGIKADLNYYFNDAL